MATSLWESTFPPKCDYFMAYKQLFKHCQMTEKNSRASLPRMTCAYSGF